MAWTQADISNLEAAIGSGILRVRYDGPPAREVQYQDLGAMRSLLAQMRAEVGAAGGRPAYRRIATGKGL